MTTCLVDTTPLFAGTCAVSLYPGRGIPGAAMRAATATGTHGPGLLFPWWDAGDDAKEFLPTFDALPTAGVFKPFEDGSYLLTGAPDGSYAVTTRALVDGANIGAATSTITVGNVFAVTGAGGIPSGEAFGQAAVSFGSIFNVASAGGIPSGEAFGNPSFAFDMLFALTGAGGIPSGEAFGTPTCTFTGAGAPSAEPVTWSDIVIACRLDATSPLQPLVLGAIAAARGEAEHITGRAYKRRVVRLEFDDWPDPDERHAVTDPVSVAVSCWNGSAWAPLDVAAVAWAPLGLRTEVAPALDTSWPPLGRRAAGARVRFDFTVGPADPADAPECVKLYIKAQVAAFLANPEAVSKAQMTLSPLYDRLLDSERTWH